jgi:hypothetical protein
MSPLHVKARQSSKIRKIGDALIALGYLALDEQAKALGLARSTAWTILQANHKSSGPLGNGHQPHAGSPRSSSSRPCHYS